MGKLSFLPMYSKGDSKYGATFLPAVLFRQRKISYRIIAQDNAGNAQISDTYYIAVSQSPQKGSVIASEAKQSFKIASSRSLH